jgi:hypothetical protein
MFSRRGNSVSKLHEENKKTGKKRKKAGVSNKNILKKKKQGKQGI